VIKARVGADLDQVIRRLFPFVFRWKINPDWLSLIGLGVSLGAAVGFSQGAFRLGAVLVLAGGFFDLVDGVVARAQGAATTFGGFLDSSLDRVVDMALLLALMMFWAQTGRTALAWICAWALVASVMVSYTKARAESVLPGFKGGLLERAERVVLLAAGGLFGLMPFAVAMVAVGASITACQRIAIAQRGMRALDAEAQGSTLQEREPGGTDDGGA